MTTPAFVNSGAKTEGTSGTATAVLPASLVTGNLLLAYVQCTGGAVTFSIGAGWTIADQVNVGSGSDSCWAYRYVDGSEAAPSFTIALTTWGCQVYQFSGVKASSPIGAIRNNSGNSSTVTVASITTTGANSLIVGLLFSAFGPPSSMPTPSGYTSRDSGNDAAFAFRVCDQPQTTIGASSTAISSTITSTPWSAYQLELLSVPPQPEYPSFINAGALATGSSVSHLSAALPSGLVVGNLLIAMIQVDAPDFGMSASSGWNNGRYNEAPGATTAMKWFWRFVDGTQTACDTTFASSNHTAQAQIFQFGGVRKPPGTTWLAGENAEQDTTTDLTNSNNNFLTHYTYSMSLAMMMDRGSSNAISNPAGWTSIANNSGATFSWQITTHMMKKYGTKVADIHVTITSADWMFTGVELPNAYFKRSVDIQAK